VVRLTLLLSARVAAPLFSPLHISITDHASLRIARFTNGLLTLQYQRATSAVPGREVISVGLCRPAYARRLAHSATLSS
jgi:hypothetical protein